MAAISWKKGVNGNWTTASDWSTDTVPGPADDASLSATGTYKVTSDASVAVNSLRTAKGATLEIAAGNFIALFSAGLGVTAGKIQVADGASFEVDANYVDNTGTIELNSTGDATTLLIGYLGQVYLKGTGKVVLSDNPNNAIAGTLDGRLYNEGNTISGAGQIGVDANRELFFQNDAGTVAANSATHALTIDTGDFVYNGGLMEATGGGMLVIDDVVDNYVGSNFGTIKASGASAIVLGSTVNLHSASLYYAGGSIYGGTVTIGAGGTLEATATGGTQQPSMIDYGAVVTDNGTLLATLGSTLTLANTTINATISETKGVIAGGLIEASDATIVLSGVTINGGALETASGGVIETASNTASTLNHVTIGAGVTVTVVDDSTLS